MFLRCKYSKNITIETKTMLIAALKMKIRYMNEVYLYYFAKKMSIKIKTVTS